MKSTMNEIFYTEREIYRLRFIEIILPLKLLYKSVGFVIHHR